MSYVSWWPSPPTHVAFAGPSYNFLAAAAYALIHMMWDQIEALDDLLLIHGPAIWLGRSPDLHISCRSLVDQTGCVIAKAPWTTGCYPWPLRSRCWPRCARSGSPDR